jgi:hypothetical protein
MSLFWRKETRTSFFLECELKYFFIHSDASIQRIFQSNYLHIFFCSYFTRILVTIERTKRILCTFEANTSFIMIQRIQTIFLALPGVLLLVLLYIPLFTYTNSTSHGTHTRTLQEIPMAMVSFVVIDLLGFLTIFAYKKRQQQILLCRFGILLSAAFSAALIAFPNWFVSLPTHISPAPAIGTWLTLLNMAFFFLAAYFIRKDEELVRSTDRLR